MSLPLLDLKNVTIKFGGLTAVSDLSISIGEGELVGLIGPNGAGKTTAFNMITGVYQPTSGEIRFAGKNTLGVKPNQLAGLGIARTFQNIRLFRSMSVLDNVRVAARLHNREGFFSSLWRGKRWRSAEVETEKNVMELLDIFNLGEQRDEP
ncbi:MAG: ATP-binding cassette domain-containing protein, partial [Akkermansiaceae bacterium]|nr:ATP-binding cassette domain-containing protein [Akkermansiaceae bacterium]